MGYAIASQKSPLRHLCSKPVGELSPDGLRQRSIVARGISQHRHRHERRVGGSIVRCDLTRHAHVIDRTLAFAVQDQYGFLDGRLRRGKIQTDHTAGWRGAKFWHQSYRRRPIRRDHHGVPHYAFSGCQGYLCTVHGRNLRTGSNPRPEARSQLLRYRCHTVRWETSDALREHPKYKTKQAARCFQRWLQEYSGKERP